MRVQIGRSSHFPTSQVAQPEPTSKRGTGEGELPRRQPAGGVEQKDVFTPYEPGRKRVELSGAQQESFSTLSTSSKPGSGGELSGNGQRLEIEDFSS
jgi:hypothetical protein